MGFIKTVFIIVFIYLCLKWVAKYLTPILLKHIIGKYSANQQQWQTKNDTTKEGDINIKQPTTEQKKKFSGGEYVDFEDVSEK